MKANPNVSPELEGMNLEFYMQAALEEAAQAGKSGELPIGAVVVLDKQIISRGRARHKELRSQLQHAELNALLAGGERLWLDFRRAILFTTVEPCPLCLGAAVMADIPHIIFGLKDKVVHSQETLDSNPYVRRHIRTYLGGVLETEARLLFERFDPASLRYILTGGLTGKKKL